MFENVWKYSKKISIMLKYELFCQRHWTEQLKEDKEEKDKEDAKEEKEEKDEKDELS